MKARQCKRVLSLVLAMALTAQGFGTMGSVTAAGKLTKLSAQQSDTQMSSEPEVVYANHYGSAGRTQNFDSNWKFYLGEAGGAESVNYDDSKWKQISLPHDYSIDQPFSQAMEAESGYLPGGTGWYRKSFTLGSDLQGKRVRIDFDGVYMNATVYVNGQELGTHPYGYTPFSFDITDYVKLGEENTIAVKVDHRTPSSRWYSGSGIYRSVNLTVTDDVHVDLFGTKIETPDLAQDQSNVKMTVKTDVVNDSDAAKSVVLTHTVFEKGGDASEAIGSVTTDAQTVNAKTSQTVNAEFAVTNPALWGVNDPHLYTVRTEVKVDDTVVDTYDSDYGFRYFAFNKDTGFSLNGENLKLQGVCMHHDQGALGAVANKRAIERQVEILQEMGCNSIRVTHNPAAQNLIDVCNEKGILVIEEFFDGWMYHKNGNGNDYATWFNAAIGVDNQLLHSAGNMTWAEFDLKATVKRGQNAPSIIMWSLGNEIQEGTSYSNGYAAKSQELIQWTKDVDTTRPVTIGSNAVKNGNQEQVAVANNVTAAGGVSGTNYSNGGSYDSLRTAHPDWIIYGSETASSVNSRGIYTTKSSNSLDGNKQLTSYDKSCVGWGALASAAWYDVITRDFVAGEYVWTGFDYIGEPTPANKIEPGAASGWPSPKNSYFGIIDTAGFPKDSYYLYQSQWNDAVHTLHILPTWNENTLIKDGSNNVEVVVYSDAAKVELWLDNGTTNTMVGEQTFTTNTTENGYTYQTVDGKSGHESLYMTFTVPYEAGTLYAKAFDEDGQQIMDTEGRSAVVTTGAAAKLSASADREEIMADGKDLAYITVDVTDENGNIVPDAADRVSFTVEGNGVLVGVDNGSSPDHDSYKGTSRKAFSGKVLAIVQSTKDAGEVTVTASAEGLESSSVTFTTRAVDGGTTEEKQADSFLMSKIYYVKLGNQPQLPQTIETRYNDGTEEELPVTWTALTDEEVKTAGSYIVKGRVNDQFDVSVNVTMIDKIGGLLNYSTTTPVGVIPNLPESRAAVMQDGSVMDTVFPVTWNTDGADYSKPGTVEIAGSAEVLGQKLNVKATVRVQAEQITIGNSISGAAYLSQSVPEGQQSDTLNAIKDGVTTVSANTSGGPNPTVWSNYDYAQAGNTKAELTFRYDTQQRFGEIVIYFASDSWSMSYPDAGTTEIYISENGVDGSWTKLEAAETIADSSTNVKAYTYSFAPVGATFVKFCLTNYSGAKNPNAKPCTGITEIELKEATGKFTTNTTAKLAEVTVNDKELTADELAKDSYKTSAIFANVEAVPADNAAVTVLPAYEDQVKMIVESEDHMTRKTFTILLGQEEVSDLPAGDDTQDYPREKCTASAGSVYQGNTGKDTEGPAEYVLDNNYGTHWHTDWENRNTVEDVKDRWIALTLEEPTKLEALRYLPRSGNGDVTEYKVQYRKTENGEWQDISTGTWERDGQNWKLAVFDRPVEAKQVRLVGVHTYVDSGNDTHMSAAEIRVRKAAAGKTDINGEDFEITVPETVEVSQKELNDYPAEAEVIVKQGEKALHYGFDYLLAYENNTAAGTATVTISGIGEYSGSVEKQFTIAIRPEEAPKYTVTVEGGDGSGDYLYNTAVIAKADKDNGQTFKGWEVNGKIVSTDENYRFFVSGDMTVKAVYEDAEVTAEAMFTNVIVTQNETPGKYDVKFVAQLVVPSDYKLKDAGLVWSNKGAQYATDTMLVLEKVGQVGVKATHITKISTTYQYSVTIKGVPEGTKLPGRVFATITKDGAEKTFYSNDIRMPIAQ